MEPERTARPVHSFMTLPVLIAAIKHLVHFKLRLGE
jgi:hypothetical protein